MPSPSVPRSLLRSTIAAVCLVALVACNAAGDDVEPTASPTAAGATTSPTGPTPSGSDSVEPTDPATATEIPDTQTEAGGRGIVAWILSLGPGAPSGPGDFRAFNALREQRCQDVLDQMQTEAPDDPGHTLYTGAAQACLAATQGRDDLWDDAQRAREQVAGSVAALTCLERAVFDLLDRLLDVHEEHPAGIDIRAGPDGGQAPPCPTIDGLDPSSGPGGTTVTVRGQHLGDVTVGVYYDDDPGDLPDEEPVIAAQDDSSVTFTIDGAGRTGPVCVVVLTAPGGWAADGELFTLETDTTSDTSPTPDATPSAEVTAAAAQGEPTCPPPPSS